MKNLGIFLGVNNYMKNKFLLIFLVFVTSIYSEQLTFKMTTPMKIPRHMYGSVVLGDYIYVISGSRENSGFTKSVEFARINPDGSIGQWQETTELPVSRCYIDNSTLALNDIVYVVAGKDGEHQNPLSTIVWARPRIDGSLEKWFESIPFPGAGIQNAPAVATPGYIHLIGGLEGGTNASSKIWSAKVGSDGSIISWEQSISLPIPLWYHCAGVAGGNIWVWGGAIDTQKTKINQQVFFAPILSSGKIGQWQTSPQASLPVGFFASPCTVSGGYLISFCPRYTGDIFSNDIWYAYVYPQGLSKWMKQPTANVNVKVYIGMATDYRRGNVYIPSGRINRNDFIFDPNVYYIKLASGQQSDAKTDTAVTIDQSIQSASSSRLSYIAQTTQRAADSSGFVPFEIARQSITQKAMPLVIYFHSSKAKRCIEQSQQLAEFNASAFKGKVILSEVETTSFPQISQQYGIFRVPCWIFCDIFGKEKGRKVGVIGIQELEGYIKQIIQ